MSFTPAGRSADRSWELVRQSLLQSDGLPFQDALTTEQMRQAFDAEGVSFGEAERDANDPGANDGGPDAADHDGIVYTRGVTLWAMLSQALFTDVQRACRAAVQRVAVPCPRGKTARCSGARCHPPTRARTAVLGRKCRRAWFAV